ncbi:trigger factor [Caldisalinibacter kiritimatiensis]|uniref:Trigger factor n=1 Tax=Caldisalinibacter kiritimatiensis TaxID=1304284 RepID=R1CLM7_9FIRM|nr:trigger factor [Caldisalinibacter kiritimatiensis]EOC99600.1 Cell division trigger factor [Caldisalinibacter kiritimatiensis]
MKSQVISKENTKVTLEIEVDVEKFEEAVQKSYLKNRKRFNIPGFRKGKAPRKIIESRYGKGIFYEDAINIVLPEAYDKAIEENELEPIDRPSIDIKELEDNKPVVFTVEVTVKPEVKLGDYKGIEVEKVEYNVTEEDVEEEIKRMQERNARLVEVQDRAVKEGDILTIDYKGFADGEQFEGGTAENQTLEIGSGRFIPGFEDQLVGKNKGDEVEVNVTFPEDYHAEDLAGKEAKFEVKIHEIKEKELPELDDEFAKDVSEFDTLDELKEDLKKRLEEQAENREKVENENNVIEKVLENTEVEVPEVLVDREIDYQVRDFEQRLLMQGLKLDQYLEMTNTKLEDVKEQIRPNAEKAAKTDLVLEAISEAENIEATDEDLDKELERMAEQYNQDADKFKENMRKGDLEYLKVGIIKRKTVEFLVENAKLV